MSELTGCIGFVETWTDYMGRCLLWHLGLRAGRGGGGGDRPGIAGGQADGQPGIHAESKADINFWLCSYTLGSMWTAMPSLPMRRRAPSGTVGPLKFGGTLAEKDSRGGGTGNHADALGVQQDSPVRISSG